MSPSGLETHPSLGISPDRPVDSAIVGEFLPQWTTKGEKALVALNWLIGWITFRSKTLEHLVEGRPIILVHGGHVDRQAMRQSQMTMHELESALRAGGCCGPDDVRFAVLENNGEVTVIPREKRPPQATGAATVPLAPA